MGLWREVIFARYRETGEMMAGLDNSSLLLLLSVLPTELANSPQKQLTLAALQQVENRLDETLDLVQKLQRRL
jgi:hypothetical protein